MSTHKRTTEHKINVFARLFQGLRNVYGTYSLETGKHWQIKQKVTKKTIYEHLKGNKPYGFYPLIRNKTRVGAVDFDITDPEPALQFIKRAKHYEIPAYLERSKSKGYHVWMFFQKEGVLARKARLIINQIINDIECLQAEIFPKQDVIDENAYYGNFINAPLFGRLVLEGKTVFIQPDSKLEPFPDQWEFLESIERINENILDSIININSLEYEQNNFQDQYSNSVNSKVNGYSLPVCIRKMLEQGVTFDQRVSCFRIAVHLKRVGLPYDGTVAALLNWRHKNQPIENRRIITPEEVKEQVKWAYKKNYSGYGCEELIVKSFCEPECFIKKKSNNNGNL